MKRRYLSILAPAALALVITGCGKAADKSMPAESSSVQSESSSEESKEAKSDIGNENYVYAKINVPYADYYYGEINNIDPEADPEKLTAKLDAADPAAAIRDDGNYDAVSSVTNKKAEKFTTAVSEVVGDGSTISGVKEVNVAISKSLYEDAKKAIEEKKESTNPLLTFVAEITETTDKVPAEYKVLNSDGTISKTVGNTVKNDLKSTITTTSNYGNYQIDIKDLELEVGNVQGVVFETKEGKKYGMEHMENIWRSPAELAFAAAPFTEKDGNAVSYIRYQDLPGQTISKITYLLKDADDIEIDTDLFCKLLAPENYSIKGDESANYSKDGSQIKFEITSDDSKYNIGRIVSRKKDVDIANVKEENGTLVLPKELVPGKYQFIFTNDKYADLNFSAVINSNLTAEQFHFENNALKLDENEAGLTVKDYISAITYAKVNDTEYKGGKGRKFGKVAFNEDGSINLDAKYSSDGKDEPVFADAGTYTVVLKADGYPDLTIEVTK